MARNLSVYRRRVGLVDVIFPARPGAKSYQFSVSPNWDTAVANFQIVPAYGFRSASVLDVGMADGQFRGKTRFVFNPADYVATVPALDDAKPFYLHIVQTDWDGTVHPIEAQHLILPYSSAPNRPLVLRGTAPAAATIAGSVEVQLPMQCRNFRFQVDGGTDAYVAFEPNGPEIRVPALSVEFTTVESTFPAGTQLFLRGDSLTTVIGILAEIHNNPSA